MYSGAVLFWLVTALVLAAGQEAEEEEEEETEPPPLPGPPLVPMCELVASFGYKCEEHVVTTEDGYKLDIYHVACNTPPKGPVVLLVHGLMGAGEMYTLKNESVAYQLCDSGVDVWIQNLRGNAHGRKHSTLDPNTDEQFWDFSYTEFGTYDIPAAISLVKEKTKAEKIYFYGHSLGTSAFFVMLNTKPNMAGAIKEAILMAPVFYTTKFQYMLKEGSSMLDATNDALGGFRKNKLWEAFPRPDVNKTEHQITCDSLPDMAIGYCKMGIDEAKPVAGEFLPAGTSEKLLEHLAQTYVKGKIHFFDYGSEEENKKKYGSPTPPEIEAGKASMKVHLFYCDADHLVGVPDADKLKEDLPNLGISDYIEDENFNHADFLFPVSEGSETFYAELIAKVKEIIK